LCLMPGEAEALRAAGVAAQFVGHPVVEDARELGLGLGFDADELSEDGWRRRCKGDVVRTQLGDGSQSPVVAVLPGSRRQEIRRHLPVFRDAVAALQVSFPRLACVVPMVPHLIPEVRDPSPGRQDQRFPLAHSVLTSLNTPVPHHPI
jgi:lipid-A-disaccharide synthase